MKVNLLLFTSVLMFIVSCTESKIDATMFIANVTTIDAKNGLQNNRVVAIREDRIIGNLSTEEVVIPKGAQILDGAGKFLMPGLWDAHVHFAYIEDLAPVMFDLFLRYGVTSVRDTGGKIEFVKEWQAKSKALSHTAPRVMIAGPLIDGVPNVYDGSTPSRPELSVETDGVTEAEEVVGHLAQAGVDHLKAYEMLSPEQFSAIANTARELGLKVTGHVPLSMDVISASNAGLNSMEHMRNLEMSCASNSDELLEARRKMLEQGKGEEGGVLRSRIHQAQRQSAIADYDEEQAERVLKILRQNDTWQIPTLSIMTGMSERPFIRKEWQESFELLPPNIKEQWMEGVRRIGESEVPESNKIYTKWSMHMVQKIHKMGIPIMAGTDCPIFFLTPGRSLHEELDLLVQSGLSPLEAIKTATVRPAQYFNLDHELGLIEEGMIADLVLLDANPLENIANTLSIHSVIKNGRIYEGAE